MRAKHELKKNTAPEECQWEVTINLAKATYKRQFKKKAPRAIKAIRQFAQKLTGTEDVRIDDSLNKFVWSKGIRYPPRRVRVTLTRQRNNDDNATNPLYTLVQYAPVDSHHGLLSIRKED